MKVLLVDGNGIQWRAYHSKGLDDNGLRKGILNYIFALLNKFSPDEVILFWDISKSRWRRSFYPSYKMDREESQSELDLNAIFSQVEESRKLLESVGLRNVGIKGIEADDLISWFSEYYSDYKGFEVVIVSGDKDLWQLVNDRVFVYDYLKNEYITKRVVKEKLGVSVEDVAFFKSLVGDTSDGIAGVKGVGAKTAGKILNEYGDLENFLRGFGMEDLKSKKVLKKIFENIEDMKFSYKLVKSPCFYDSRWFLTEDELKLLKASLEKELSVDYNYLSLIEEDLDDFTKNGLKKLPKLSCSASDMTMYMEKLDLGDFGYKDLNYIINDCKNCSLCTKSLSKNYPKIGSNCGNSKIMVVLDRELCSEEIFMFDEFLDMVGLAYKDIWLTYSKKCDSFYPMEYGQMEACLWIIKNEIGVFRPDLIISCGSDSMICLTDLKGKATDHVGELVKLSPKFFGEVPCEVFILNDLHNVVISESEKANFEYGVQLLLESHKGGL